MAKNKQKMNLVGYVISTDWDTEGDITQIAIETDEFETFLIEKDDVGMKLFDFVNKEVSLEGVVTGEDTNGYQIVKVSAYKLIEPAEDEELGYETDDVEDFDFEEDDFLDEDEDNN